MNNGAGNLLVNLLHLQGGGKRKTAEEQINNRVGKTGQRRLHRHRGNRTILADAGGQMQQQRADRNHDGGQTDVHRLGEPQNCNKNQQGKTLVGIR